jgi:hypothetical protein
VKPLGRRAGTVARALTATLVGALGLYLLMIGALEAFAGSRLAYSWQLVLVGAANVLVSIPHAICVVDILQRRGRARELMLWLAVVGFLWAVLRAVVLGNLFQIAGAPLYVALGILAIRGRHVFAPPPEVGGRSPPER